MSSDLPFRCLLFIGGVLIIMYLPRSFLACSCTVNPVDFEELEQL